ncbi:hypothetical protein ACFOE1_06300 [Agromyces mediolanus]|uniref:Uncharacterized protein n=1 Tax=Agromyces mediolanus TaxID=41986 RepID=A0A918CJH7_AGRME|nr:hypothetical protein [Agromyces mediolanus]GGR27438.1 hypothetical protein GCM10010196_21290 [Agromyces mediolanus]GLJ71925.1 hypothetical protein GCM10017583_11810 [Agromyces mediolanus]
MTDDFLRDAGRDELLLEELRRQLSDVASRQANAITRASIILAAAVAITAIEFTSAPNVWMVGPVLLAVASAIPGFAAIWLWKSQANVITVQHIREFRTFPADAVRTSFINDLQVELDAARRDLRRKNKAVQVALLLLVTAWLSAVVIALTLQLSGGGDDMTEPTTPTPPASAPAPAAAPPSMVTVHVTAGAKPRAGSTYIRG